MEEGGHKAMSHSEPCDRTTQFALRLVRKAYRLAEKRRNGHHRETVFLICWLRSGNGIAKPHRVAELQKLRRAASHDCDILKRLKSHH